MTKDDALRLISGMYCFAIVARTGLRIPEKDCRTMWPAESSEWCASCIAQQAIDEVDGSPEAITPLKVCGCDARNE